MDIFTFKQIVAELPLNVSVIIRGRHGIGKSEIVYQLANEVFNLPVVERRLSQITEGDMIGLPHKEERFDKDGNVTRASTKFLPLDWFADCIETPHLIFLDEFDRSSNEVQQAAFELVLDRSIQGNKIHPECRIYSAINGGPTGANYNVLDMDPALLDRFWVADLKPSVEEWLKWAQGKILPEIIEFVRSEQRHLEYDGVLDPGKVYPSRRSWKRLSDTIQRNPSILENSLILTGLSAGFIGIEATAMFQDYIINRKKTFTAEDILDRYPHIEHSLKIIKTEEQNNIIGKLYDHSVNQNKPLWTSKQIENIKKFFVLLPNEIKMSMWDSLSKPECKKENAHSFAKSIADILISLV